MHGISSTRPQRFAHDGDGALLSFYRVKVCHVMACYGMSADVCDGVTPEALVESDACVPYAVSLLCVATTCLLMLHCRERTRFGPMLAQTGKPIVIMFSIIVSFIVVKIIIAAIVDKAYQLHHHHHVQKRVLPVCLMLFLYSDLPTHVALVLIRLWHPVWSHGERT